MTGVKAPAAVLGTSVVVSHAAKGPVAGVLGGHAARGTLPFTGVALSIYLVIGLSLVLVGIALRAYAKVRG
jgi:hypothetical protein